MITDDQTGEWIETDGSDLLEMMARHFAGRIAAASPDAPVEDAAVVGVRVGISFFCSLIEQTMNKESSLLFMAMMHNAMRQRALWKLDDMTRVAFMDMTPRAGDMMN